MSALKWHLCDRLWQIKPPRKIAETTVISTGELSPRPCHPEPPARQSEHQPRHPEHQPRHPELVEGSVSDKDRQLESKILRRTPELQCAG
jgi:hypothetical protein